MGLRRIYFQSLFTLSLVILSPIVFAQTVVNGKSFIDIDVTMSFLEARKIVEERAKLNALGNLGTYITSDQQMVMVSEEGSKKTKFSSIASASSMGIWMKTLEGYPIFRGSIKEGFIECEIKGIARDLLDVNVSCDLSFGSDSTQFIFSDSEEIEIHAQSSLKGFTYIFGYKIGSNEVSLIESPQSFTSKKYGLEKPVKMRISLDDKANDFEEYLFTFIQTENEIPENKFSGKSKTTIPQGRDLQQPDITSQKGFTKLIKNLSVDQGSCITEQGLIIKQ